MQPALDVMVVGAGVVGLAVARALARRGREVVVLEAGEAPGAGLTSRNSGVIHAGLYYPPGSLKARCCVAGRDLLYAFADEHGIAVRQCGKLIVAVDEAELPRLRLLAETAEACGAGRLDRLDRSAVRRRAPAIMAAGALYSPLSGVIDSHALVWALVAEIEAMNGELVYCSKIISGHATEQCLEVTLADGTSVSCRSLINAAGLGALSLARAIEGADPRALPLVHFAQGQWFDYLAPPPTDCLVYPLPVDGGLGIHLTVDVHGTVRFGPDVHWVEEADFSFDETRRDSFVTEIRQYFPGLREDRLRPGFASVRPKLSAPGAPAADFLLLGPQQTGIRGLVHLLGIESPGLTAALAIAEHVADMLHPGV